MKNIKGVFKKEFDKVFKFPRAIFSTLILPGLIIFIIYFFIGQAAKGQIQDIAEHRSQIYVVNEPTSFLNIRQALTGDNDMLCDFYQSSLENLADLQNQVKEGDIDALIVFDADFDQKTDNNEKPMVHLYYNSTKNNSSVANNKLLTIIEMEKSYYLQK
ncbi:MAG: ABC transporter permease, partial [Acholeplasmataceae bacterium]|nr:ABC transporter permease [Acholeplasmataceae bacterium]